MTAQSSKLARKPHTGKPYNRKYNRNRVKELAEIPGITATLIAKDQDVSLPTITRFLKKHDIEIKQIKHFNSIKADSLSLSQLKNQTIESIIKDNWLSNPDILLSQDVKTQKDIIHTMQGGRYYDHQAERLERDLSTVNTASIHADIAEIRSLKRGSMSIQGSEQNTQVVDITSKCK
jgi:hypothetical protein